MIDTTNINKFIVDMDKETKLVRMTIEYSESTAEYTARLVDHYYSTNIAMLDINGAHYLLGKGATIEEAIEELEYKVEMQYC